MRGIVLLLMLLSLPGSVAAFNIDFYVTSITPRVFEPGSRANVTLAIKNLGTDYAVYVRGVWDPNGTSPLAAIGAAKLYFAKKASEAKTSEEFFGIVKQDDELTASYEVYVSDSAKFGVYNVPLKIIWRDQLLQLNEETITFGVQIAGKADLRIASVSTTPSRVRPDDEYTLSLKVENIGKEDAESVRATLVLPSDFRGDSSAFLGTINKGSSGTANFNLKVVDTAKPGGYELPVELTYLEKGIEKKAVRNFKIFVQELGEITLVITQVATNPSKVYPDSDFSLSFGLENAGKGDAKSVEVEFIFPKDFIGETSAFLGSLKKGGTASTELDLRASKEASSGAYDIPVKIRYLDERGVEESVEKKFQIFLHERSEIKIEIAGITSSPAKVHSGDDFTLSIQLENVGKQDAKSVKAVIQPINGFTGERTSFLGSLKVDDLSTAIFELEASEDIKSGIYDVNLVVTYTDEVGREYDEEMIFQMAVDEKPRGPLPYVVGGGALFLAALYGWRRYGSKRGEGG